MRFLVDRCAGRLLADWLERQGHDVVDAGLLGPDPGDRALLELAAAGDRVLVTIDKDFGHLL
jgi:predicted nuclease of predicted toxin-antitoxin system